jgi:hypothetical protein
MEVYYDLHCLTRRRHGLPPQPPHFFRFIQEIIITPGHGRLALARSADQWIAGAVYFEFGAKALYKFGASNPAFQHLRANNLLMWNAILHFRQKGLRELSLGRTDLGDTGLVQFKRGWGGNEFRAPYHRIGIQKRIKSASGAERSGLARIRKKLVGRMPLRLLRWVGAVSYRHFG